MGEIKTAEYYDRAFEKDKYTCKYSESEYYGLWKRVIKILPNKKILEVGCGTGQFASMLWDNGYKDYRGFDFSKQGISVAKMLSDQSFGWGDALEEKNYKDYEVLVALEVFEHLEDYTVLSHVETGKTIVITIPRFDDPAHVRYFKPMMEVCARYEQFIRIQILLLHESWFILRGIRI